jgi:23S rRNA G2069 N7-methylase RlmK/C1962 C5-methylase RlmI
LSGLIVDVFGDLAVIASSAAWVENYKPEVEACINRIDGINHINWRPSVDFLKEEGMDVSDMKEVHPSTCPERIKVECASKITNYTIHIFISFLMLALFFLVIF